MQLHSEFVKKAKQNGKKLAIIDRTTEKRIDYSKALIASLLLQKKIMNYKDGFIGVMIPNSAGSILTIIGIHFAGKVPVMINYSTGAAENAEYAQKKCGFRTIITSRALLEKIGCRLVKGMVFIEDIMASISKGDKLKAALRSKMPEKLLLKTIHSGEESDNAVILFTSGSEKDPKGVQLTHKNLLSNIESSLKRMEFTSDDIVLGILPFFHVFGQMANLWLTLTTGATIVSYANPLDYKKVCSIIKEEKISVMIATPVFLNGYLRQSKQGDFESIRLAVSGADKTPKALYDSYIEKHNINIMEGYGATETSPVVSLNCAEFNKPGSIGKPLDNVRVRILDINTGEELPIGQEGRLVVKGENIMRGYFNDIEETTRRIQNGWYDTGDMGMIDEDGFVWHRGRLKRFVKIAGEMVSLVRVESEIINILPENIDCCVVEVPDSIKGAKIIVAITGDIDEKEILKKLQEKLPAIAIPKRFVFIKELPKMGSGKINFRGTTDMIKDILRKEN